MKAEFNLCEEPWILVMGQDCSVRELSLPEVLIHAHEYVRLSGEMPAQDVAVLRLLLAVLHRIYADGLYKEKGEEIVHTAGPQAYIGREVEVKADKKSGKKRKTAETGTAGGKKELYCAPYLYQRLLRNIQNIMKH